MAVPKRNIKGLQDIRTLAGNVDMIFEPYRAYMKISCLEMEKARRGNERTSAMQRVQNIDARFKEIEAEKAELLKALGISRRTGDVINASGTEPKAAVQRGPKGFKINY